MPTLDRGVITTLPCEGCAQTDKVRWMTGLYILSEESIGRFEVRIQIIQSILNTKFIVNVGIFVK